MALHTPVSSKREKPREQMPDERAWARDPGFRRYRWYTLSTPLLMLLAGQANVMGIFPAGVPERLANLVVLVWIEVVALRLLWLALKREPAPGKTDGMKW